MRIIEMHYSVAEAALLLRCCTKTILEKLRGGELGTEVVNLGSKERPDYRIPASGLSAFLERRRVFREPGIAARSIGELRRKSAAQEVQE